MTNDIWSAHTDTEWIKFNNGLNDISGDSESSFSIDIDSASNINDEQFGKVYLYSNGNTTEKTIVRCVPKLISQTAKLTFSGNGTAPLCGTTGGTALSYFNLSDILISYKRLILTPGDDAPHEEIVEEHFVNADNFLKFFVVDNMTYVSDIPSNVGQKRNVYLVLQYSLNPSIVSEPTLIGEQAGLYNMLDIDMDAICETGHTETRHEYSNFYIDIDFQNSGINEEDTELIDNIRIVSAHSPSEIVEGLVESFNGFKTYVRARKYIGPKTGKTCCDPKIEVQLDIGRYINCMDCNYDVNYSTISTIDNNLYSYFSDNSITLYFYRNTSHSITKNILVAARLVDEEYNVRVDSYRRIKFLVPPDINGPGYEDILLNLESNYSELEYNENLISFIWFLTKNPEYIGYEPGTLSSVKDETIEAFKKSMSGSVFITIDGVVREPRITYIARSGIFQIVNYNVGNNLTTSDRIIKMSVDNCFLASNPNKEITIIQHKVKLYAHAYITYQENIYTGKDEDIPTMPLSGGIAYIQYFVSETENINKNGVFSVYSFKNQIVTNNLSHECPNGVTCEADEGDDIKMFKVEVPAALGGSDTDFEFTLSCNGYSNPYTVKITRKNLTA